jgi:hypothetical protein
VGAALGDANRSGDLTQANAGVLRDAKQDMGVIGDEVPTGPNFASHHAMSSLEIKELNFMNTDTV